MRRKEGFEKVCEGRRSALEVELARGGLESASVNRGFRVNIENRGEKENKGRNAMLRKEGRSGIAMMKFVMHFSRLSQGTSLPRSGSRSLKISDYIAC